MGRTLTYHFKKDNGKKFTDAEIETIIQVRDKYTTGKFAKVWSCECFFPEPINYLPAWEGSKAFEIKLLLRHELKNADGYAYMAYLENKVVELMNSKPIKIGYKHEYSFDKKLSRVEAFKLLAKEGWLYIENPDLKEIHGFIKVQGNELNAALTYLAIKEITTLIPTMVATLKDEGEFLLSPIKMKQGKAMPLLSDMVDDMQHFALKMLFSKGFAGNILDKLEHKDFCHEFTMDMNIDNSYGDMTRYINEKLRNIKEIEKRIYNITPSDNYNGKNALYFYNMERADISKWYEADLFTRINQIDTKHFVTYKMTPATLMDGFSGGYYNLSDEDAEAESYKRIAQMQKLLGKLGVAGNMEVLGERKVA